MKYKKEDGKLISLKEIREAVIRQDNELEEMIALYFIENNLKSKKESKEESKSEFENYKECVKNSIKSFIEKNQLEQAKILIEKYKKIVNDDASIYSMEGIVYLQENNLEMAHELFRRGLDIDSDNIDLLYNIGYVNIILNNREEALEYYRKCMNLTDDQNIISEIEDIIHNLLADYEISEEIQTFITIGLDKDDILFKSINLEENRVINIIENNELSYEKYYEHEGISVYEVNSEQYLPMINYLLRNNNNVKLICSDYKKYNLLLSLNYDKIVYYTNINTFTDKTNYLDINTIRYLEDKICDASNIIITNDINVYIFKKIVEGRSNIYLFNDIDEIFDLNKILLNNKMEYDTKVEVVLKEYLKLIDNEYEKSLYLLASECKNIDNCLEIISYIYNKYKTEDMYILYSSLLSKKEDYVNLISLILNSEYCNEVIKAELLYLNAIGDYDLIKFINNIQIRDYNNIKSTSDKNLTYKNAIYNFELNQFDVSYDGHLMVLAENMSISNSPLINRNISYLMYAKGNDNYKQFYYKYKELLKCLDSNGGLYD